MAVPDPGRFNLNHAAMRLSMRPTMASLSSSPLRLVVLSSDEGATLFFGGHPAACVAKLYFNPNYPPRHGGARWSGLNCQRAAVRHGFSTLSERFTNTCSNWVESAATKGRLGLRVAHRGDAGIFQLVSHQQIKFLDQAVQIHWCRLGLHRARQ